MPMTLTYNKEEIEMQIGLPSDVIENKKGNFSRAFNDIYSGINCRFTKRKLDSHNLICHQTYKPEDTPKSTYFWLTKLFGKHLIPEGYAELL